MADMEITLKDDDELSIIYSKGPRREAVASVEVATTDDDAVEVILIDYYGERASVVTLPHDW